MGKTLKTKGEKNSSRIVSYLFIAIEMILGGICIGFGIWGLVDNNSVVTNMDMKLHYEYLFTLGGVVIFTSGIIQIITRDKPIIGFAFSVIALIYVMTPRTTLRGYLYSYKNYYIEDGFLAIGLILECLLIPVAAIIYFLQQASLKSSNSTDKVKGEKAV